MIAGAAARANGRLRQAAQQAAEPPAQQSAQPALSVVVPAFRQEASIVADVRNLERALQALGRSYEIIVVVDGFVDATYERAQALASPTVRVLGYPQNQGKGHAVRYGMRAARGELIAFIDAGMDLDPSALGRFVAIMQRTGADIVIGSKRHPESVVEYPWLRRLYSAGYQALVWALFGLNVRDTQVGLKLFRRAVIDDVEPVLLVKRFAFDIELLVVAALMGHGRIVEAPVILRHGRFPSTIRLRAVFDMLWDTAAVFYRARVRRYYQRLAQAPAARLEAPAAEGAALADPAVPRGGPHP